MVKLKWQKMPNIAFGKDGYSHVPCLSHYWPIDYSSSLQCRWSLEVPNSTYMEQRDKSTWNFAKGTDKSSLFDDSQTRADSLMFQRAKVSLYYACKFHQARLYPEYKVSPRLPFTLVLLPMIMQGNTKKIRKNAENGKPNYSDPNTCYIKELFCQRWSNFIMPREIQDIQEKTKDWPSILIMHIATILISAKIWNCSRPPKRTPKSAWIHNKKCLNSQKNSPKWPKCCARNVKK